MSKVIGSFICVIVLNINIGCHTIKIKNESIQWSQKFSKRYKISPDSIEQVLTDSLGIGLYRVRGTELEDALFIRSKDRVFKVDYLKMFHRYEFKKAYRVLNKDNFNDSLNMEIMKFLTIRPTF